MRIRWTLALLVVALVLPSNVRAQSQDNLVVIRNVNLRRDPSTNQPPIRLLRPPDELELLSEPPSNKENNYYHVRTGADEEGWVYSPNVRLLPAGATEPQSPDSAPGTPASAPAIAAAVSASWPKPAPHSGTFSSHGEACGPTGDGGDAETNVRKNRTDLPTAYNDVTFDAIGDLAYPTAKPHRHDWTQAQLNDIAPFEGAAVRLVGYLVAIKPQSSGSGESTNCHWTAPSEVDWHIALVKESGQGEETALVVETTPRIRKSHPKWTPAALHPWLDTDAPVRISGWLMIDPEHRNHLNKYRKTLWEVHPITKIEVWKDGAWADLDAMSPH